MQTFHHHDSYFEKCNKRTDKITSLCIFVWFYKYYFFYSPNKCCMSKWKKQLKRREYNIALVLYLKQTIFTIFRKLFDGKDMY